MILPGTVMLPSTLLSLALLSDPAAVSAWPVPEADAELAVAEGVWRERAAACLKALECTEGEKIRYGDYLKSIGGGTDEQRKQLAVFARNIDELKTALADARDRKKEIQQLREKERKLRAELSKAEKR